MPPFPLLLFITRVAYGIGRHLRPDHVMLLHVIHETVMQRAQVGYAGHEVGFSAEIAKYGDGDRRERSNHADHDEQLDQRPTLRVPASMEWWLEEHQ